MHHLIKQVVHTVEVDMLKISLKAPESTAIISQTHPMLHLVTLNVHDMQHLGALLAAPDTSVVLSALHALVAFVRKTHSSSTRLQASPGINVRLLALCQGWGGKEQVCLSASLAHSETELLAVASVECNSLKKTECR